VITTRERRNQWLFSLGLPGFTGLEILFLAQTSEAKKAGPRNKKKKKKVNNITWKRNKKWERF
jgi:hypothetical protein